MTIPLSTEPAWARWLAGWLVGWQCLGSYRFLYAGPCDTCVLAFRLSTRACRRCCHFASQPSKEQSCNHKTVCVAPHISHFFAFVAVARSVSVCSIFTSNQRLCICSICLMVYVWYTIRNSIALSLEKCVNIIEFLHFRISVDWIASPFFCECSLMLRILCPNSVKGVCWHALPGDNDDDCRRGRHVQNVL